MRTIPIIILCLLLASCCPRRLTISSNTTDSIKIIKEVEYIERLRDTTIYIALPVETKERTVLQDSSFLETSLAESSARINSDGSLSHTLANKPQAIAATAQIKDTEKATNTETTIGHQEIIEVPIRPPLTWLQRALIYSGLLFWGLLLGAIVWQILKKRFQLR